MKKPVQWLKRLFNFDSIKGGLIYSFTLLIATVILLSSLMSYQYIVYYYQKVSTSYAIQLLQTVNANIDVYISSIKSMAQLVVRNTDVNSLMSLYQIPGELTPFQKEREARLKANVADLLTTMVNTQKNVTNVAILSAGGQVIFGDPDKKVNENADYQSSDWYQKALSYTADIIVSPSHVQNLVKDEYPWVISVSKAIVDRETGEVTGVLVIDLNYKAIESICEKVQLGQSGYIYLVDSDANLIYHPQQQLIYTGLKTENTADILKMPDTQSYFIDNQSKKIYTRNFSLLTGWSVVGVLNANELADQKSLINFVVLVALASILLASFLAIMISTVMTRPIKQLENTMHEVEKGNFNVRSDIRLNNEIGHLSNTFNVMVSDIQKLMEQTIRDEEEKRKSEIKALQAQINPHFLYNTLDTIIWMSASGKNDEVVEVTSALAKLFRTSISTGEMLVTLAVEIENIKSYLIIQKMRYKDKLRYRLDIPDSLLNCRLPKLILQPIVENAIYHGIKPSPTGGEILIQGSLQGENLLLSVSDNGVGMTGQQLERLFDPKDSSRGIGIHNVHNRIQLFFGNQYGLSIQSRDGEGTRVDILLPNLPMPTTPNEEGESENG